MPLDEKSLISERLIMKMQIMRLEEDSEEDSEDFDDHRDEFIAEFTEFLREDLHDIFYDDYDYYDEEQSDTKKSIVYLCRRSLLTIFVNAIIILFLILL